MSRYSTSRQIGIHLTNHHIRLVEFDGRKRVGVFGWIDLPTPLTELKKNNEWMSLKEPLIAALKNAKPRHPQTRNAILTIGDEEIFTKMIEMPLVSKDEAAAMAPHEIEPDLPMKADQLYTDAIILEEMPKEKKMAVMIFAAPRTVIDGLLAASAAAGINLQAIEAASVSLARLYGTKYRCFVTIDIGTEHGSITIVDREHIRVSTSSSFENDQWAEIIRRKSPRLSKEEAVTMYGSVVSAIADKTQTAIRYYANRAKPVCSMEQVLLSGTGANVPHLAAMLSKLLDIPTSVGSGTIDITKDGDASYYAAVGAALRNTNAND